MLSKGHKILILVTICTAVIILLIVSFIYDIRKDKQPEQQETQSEVPKVPTGVEQSSGSDYDTVPALVTEEEQEKVQVQNLARYFTERFGSYSNESNFENINDLRLVMTSKMQIWSEQYINDMQAMEAREEYTGISTKAGSVEIQEFSADSASVLVRTNRRKVTDNQEPEFFIQDIVLELKKENGQWKVDGAFWK